MTQTPPAPEQSDPRGPLIISTMKNEGPYILEWIAYHRVIGFKQFLIYTNDCDDSTVKILERLTEMGIVQHEANKVLIRGPHKSALKAAMTHPMTQAADWILVSDIDEFLNIKVGDGSVQALIDHVPNADAIPITWRLFSHDDQVKFADQLFIEHFTDAERALDNGGFVMRYAKTLFRRLDAVERLGLHGPMIKKDHEADYKWFSPNGRQLGQGDSLFRPATEFGYEAAQMNHYAVRSVDGYLVKRDRGRANHVKDILGAYYWRKMCRGGEEDTTIHRHVEATKAEMARLMEDFPLAKQHRKALRWHRAKITELRKDPEAEALRQEVMKLAKARNHYRTAAEAEIEEAAYQAELDAKQAELDAQAAEAGPAQMPEADAKPEAVEPAVILAAATTPQSAPVDAKALCAQLRAVFNQIEPAEAAAQAQARLDEIEKGLFGRTSR